MRIQRILCPTDLTADSDAALRYGATLARAYDAQLVLMYCDPDNSRLTSGTADRDGEPNAHRKRGDNG